MFDIRKEENGNIALIGRFDASQVDTVRSVLDRLEESCTIDFKELTYISSAGLGILLGTQKRLGSTGKSLSLINLNTHIRDIFLLAGFDLVFKIE